MNKTDAKIAGKLDGVECGGVKLIDHSTVGDPCLTISRECNGQPVAVMAFLPADFLTLCRTVVNEVDGKRYSVKECADQILGEQIYDGNNNTPKEYKAKNKFIRFLAKYSKDKEDGIAAVTERSRKET